MEDFALHATFPEQKYLPSDAAQKKWMDHSRCPQALIRIKTPISLFQKQATIFSNQNPVLV